MRNVHVSARFVSSPGCAKPHQIGRIKCEQKSGQKNGWEQKLVQPHKTSPTTASQCPASLLICSFPRRTREIFNSIVIQFVLSFSFSKDLKHTPKWNKRKAKKKWKPYRRKMAKKKLNKRTKMSLEKYILSIFPDSSISTYVQCSVGKKMHTTRVKTRHGWKRERGEENKTVARCQHLEYCEWKWNLWDKSRINVHRRLYE